MISHPSPPWCALNLITGRHRRGVAEKLELRQRRFALCLVTGNWKKRKMCCISACTVMLCILQSLSHLKVESFSSGFLWCNTLIIPVDCSTAGGTLWLHSSTMKSSNRQHFRPNIFFKCDWHMVCPATLCLHPHNAVSGVAVLSHLLSLPIFQFSIWSYSQEPKTSCEWWFPSQLYRFELLIVQSIVV